MALSVAHPPLIHQTLALKILKWSALRLTILFTTQKRKQTYWFLRFVYVCVVYSFFLSMLESSVSLQGVWSFCPTGPRKEAKGCSHLCHSTWTLHCPPTRQPMSFEMIDFDRMWSEPVFDKCFADSWPFAIDMQCTTPAIDSQTEQSLALCSTSGWQI